MNEKNDIHLKMVRATKWSLGAELLAKLITPFVSMILARILVPEEFGIIATISMIIGLAELLTDAGFSKYLIQHNFKNNESLYEFANTAFLANFLVSFLLWGGIIKSATFLAELVGTPGYELAIIVSSFKLILTSVSGIQRAIYQRELNYKTIFFIRITVSFIPIAITVPLALAGFGYWSLIFGTLLNELCYVVILTIKSEWKPKLLFSFFKLKKMLSFSIWSLIEQFTIWLTTYADSFIIAKYLSQYYLGIYKQPYQLINNIFSMLTASIFSILFSALSRYNDNNNLIGYKDILFKTQKILSIVIIPLGIGIFIYRSFVTSILLGSQWSDAEIVIGAFALERIVQIIINNFASEIYRSKGCPHLSVVAQLIFLSILISVCIFTLRIGFEQFVIARALLCLVFALIHLVLVYYNFRINILEIVPIIKSIIIASFIMGMTGWIFQKITSDSAIMTMIAVLICMSIYGILLIIFKDTRMITIEILENLENTRTKSISSISKKVRSIITQI